MDADPFAPSNWRSIGQIEAAIMAESGGYEIHSWGRDHVWLRRHGDPHLYELPHPLDRLNAQKRHYLAVLRMIREGHKPKRTDRKAWL